MFAWGRGGGGQMSRYCCGAQHFLRQPCKRSLSGGGGGGNSDTFSPTSNISPKNYHNGVGLTSKTKMITKSHVTLHSGVRRIFFFQGRGVLTLHAGRDAAPALENSENYVFLPQNLLVNKNYFQHAGRGILVHHLSHKQASKQVNTKHKKIGSKGGV